MNTCECIASLRTYLLIENRLFRESLARLLRKRPDFVVAGQISSADEVPLESFEGQCDVVLGDSFLLGRLPLRGAESGYAKSAWGFKIVLIGMSGDDEQFMAAVRRGVTGYLLQDASASDVVAAVRSVGRGEAVCPPLLCASLHSFVAHLTTETRVKHKNLKPDLTLRQQQLIALVAKGLTNKEIASRLNLSAFTVRNHIHRILKQVAAESRSQAVETIRAHGYSITA